VSDTPIRDGLELAWAAGFFDGEGTICTQGAKETTKRYLKIRVAHCEPQPLRRFADAVGLGNVTGPNAQKNPAWSPYYSWQLAGSRAEQALERLRPFLSEPRLEQWARAAEFLEGGVLSELAKHT
jgi:hypothetical protein